MKKVITYSIALLPMICLAQKTKVQTAWRALGDYESTVKDGKPDLVYLNKAKDAIDAALVHEDTKNQGKTHAYKARIAYAYYQSELNTELKKLEATVTDKNERALLAYGNVPLTNFVLANDELNAIKEVDPKYMEVIQEKLIEMQKGRVNPTDPGTEDDMKITQMAQQIKMEAGNIAQGKYKAKKYDEAADYFAKTGYLNMSLTGKKDTSSFYNACVAASKSKNPAKILEHNKKMVDLKISTPYNFESMYSAQLMKLDTNAAMEVLKKGRAVHPNDINLMNQETNLYLARGKQVEALTNLKASIEKDSKNPLFYLVTGNIYDNMANPKDKATGKDLPKPKDFDENFKNAETNYQNAIQNSASNKDMQYNAAFNLGAMYNNYGGYLQNKVEGTITEQAKNQKANEAKAKEFYNKAIPLLEQALTLKADDKPTMVALRKLYLLTGNEAKGKEMNDKIKAGK